MKLKPSSYYFTRLLFQRAMGCIYFIAFLVSLNQFKGLIGEHGLLPVHLFLKEIHFWDSPSLFWFNSSDPAMAAAAWAGLILSVLAVSGVSEKFGVWVSAAVWAGLWALYLSFVNVGQIFYGFGWETMTLEAGFLAIFLGSRDVEPPKAVIWFLRWILFRLMFGAGLIKLRGDACWCDFTCMYYHYETQPLPNPLSWYFHHLPHAVQKFQTFYTMFLELVIPWLYFVWAPFVWIAGILTIAFQTCLILSGNLSWLNYLTITIAISCFDDAFFQKWLRIPPVAAAASSGKGRKAVIAALACLILVLSVGPATNLFSRHQAMNASFEPLHLVNTYGAFGSVTKERTEVILEGTADDRLTGETEWKEYGYRAKPGDVHRLSPVVAPYHLRLDWLLWFAAMRDWRYHPWILHLADGLLRNDPEMLKLLGTNPFPDHPPHYVRAVLYRYRFTTSEEKKSTGDWWVREPVRLYLPPVSRENPGFREILHRLGWE